MKPKIVVGTVFIGRTPDLFVANIGRFTYPNLSYIWVDSSPSKEYHDRLEELKSGFGREVVLVKKPTIIARSDSLILDERLSDVEKFRALKYYKGVGISESFNEMRRIFLEGDGDFLLIVEDDTYPPDYAPSRLLSTYQRAASEEVAAVSAVIPLPVSTPWKFSTDEVFAWDFELREHRVDWSDKVRYKLTMYTVPYRMFGIRWVGGVSTGCILIPRETVEKVAFHLAEGYWIHQDIAFGLDVRKAGKKMLLDYGVYCYHFRSGGGTAAGEMIVPIPAERVGPAPPDEIIVEINNSKRTIVPRLEELSKFLI